METIPVSAEIPEKQADWQQSVDRYRTSALALPQVRAGAVTTAQALSWLTAVSKLHNPQGVERVINQAGGLGAKEIRALIANERQGILPSHWCSRDLFGQKAAISATARHR